MAGIVFPGQYYDQETGLHYNAARYYDPGTGRYLTSDPTGLEGGLNTYSYSLQNPVNYFDPNGENPVAAGRGAFWVGSRIGAAINYGIQATTGATLGTLLYDALHNDRVDDPAAEEEWRDHKERYRTPPPPGLDKCALLRWKLKRERQLLRDRQAWDRHWGRGTHSEPIRQSKNAIRNLKRKIKRECGPCRKN